MTDGSQARQRRNRPTPRMGRGPDKEHAEPLRTAPARPDSVPDAPARLAHRNLLRSWDFLIGLALLVAVYASVSDPLRIGPRWLVPALMLGIMFALVLALRAGRHPEARWLTLVMTGVATLAVEGSMAGLVSRLIDGNVYAPYLLRDAALLWIVNVLVFALWYWELDGGGPRTRHSQGYVPTDLAFPQIALGRKYSSNWTPRFIDYLFVAFTASAAFSPTDTSILSVRAKLLLMIQAIGSIVILAIVAARAINILS